MTSMKTVFLTAVSLLTLKLTSARLLNVTIDDADESNKGNSDGAFESRVVYSPTTSRRWTSRPCSCESTIPVNSSEVYKGTWHDATSTSPDDIQTVTITFSGNAIYLFAIEANFIPNNAATTLSNLTFILDGDPAWRYLHPPNQTSQEVSYNVPIYSNTTLQNGDHSIVIMQAARSTDDKDHTLLLFDYAIYTYDDEWSRPTTSMISTDDSTVPISTANPGSTSTLISQPDFKNLISLIVGSVVGGILVLLIALITCTLCIRRRQRRHIPSSRRRGNENVPHFEAKIPHPIPDLLPLTGSKVSFRPETADQQWAEEKGYGAGMGMPAKKLLVSKTWAS